MNTLGAFSVTWLAWYISGAFALLAVLTSLISYAPPGPAWWVTMLPVAFGISAILGAVIATVLGRLPTTHWMHRSRPFRIGVASAAVAVTLLLIAIG